MNAWHQETVTHSGRSFLVSLFPDDDHSPPWERSDGHGSVRYVDDREPLASGETILCDLRRGRYVYDLRGAIAQSIRERWGRPDKATRERLARKLRKPASKVSAIDADMDFLRGWCADDWFYIGVCVQLIGPDGEPIGDPYDRAVWGVESCGEYWREVASDIADEILHERGKAWRIAMREAREVRYWASRDVVTF